MENHGMKVIHLTGAEKQSGYDRLNFAEDLIRQLPENHEGRNTWLLNYSNREEQIRCVPIEALSGMCTSKPLKQLSNPQIKSERS